jgi:ankyrin repeat protein
VKNRFRESPLALAVQAIPWAAHESRKGGVACFERICEHIVNSCALLLAHGADPNVEDGDHQTPLHHAAHALTFIDSSFVCTKFVHKIVSKLLEFGANPSAVSHMMQSPLGISQRAAAIRKSSDCDRVVELLRLNSAVKSPEELGVELIDASAHGNLNLVMSLVEIDEADVTFHQTVSLTNVERFLPSRKTALHTAAEHGHVGVVECKKINNRCIFLLNLTRRMLCSIQTDLLFLGAPIDYMTVDGSNARDLAESNGHEICARRLREAESRANNKNYC